MQDGALEPQFFREVNININPDIENPWPQDDPYFFDDNGFFKPTSDDYDTSVFAPPEAVDHNDGAGGGFGDGTRDWTTPGGQPHGNFKRSIELNPIAQNYIVWHLRNAFGEEV